MRRPLSCHDEPLDLSPEAFGELAPLDDPDARRQRLLAHLEEHGYLYIPGFFDRRAVAGVRRAITDRLAEKGMLDADRDPFDAIPNPRLSLGLDHEKGSNSVDDVSRACRPMHDLLYGERAMSFFGRFLGGAARHFDYTWFRSIAPGLGTMPHCDIVYMGRGTRRLYTCWVPYDDIPLKMGGLMVLGGSNSTAVQQKLARYVCRDVDEYCTNRRLPGHVSLSGTSDNKVWKGGLARNPATLRRCLGGRWLTAEYAMGDAVIFPITLVHAGLDNHSDRIRLSSDSRYQVADEPADERFVGEGPFGHVGAAKRGRIC